ncbi:sigma-70 family RNA polymerase sigma factor [Gelidibacter maritimus]|uniref:Sigma-70 family RNA polymerase sigma factor n=1 Tax=Gelidibacter maritimus TaxID=2761487 RepID=A0A7W2M8J4_9FLAO|nr:sigma-70 family RNA polymerase sigma factor [Gelidibacter maritimus]MBA6154665.1 sigma-70 family RNA polymerase sigma factor [Gelidibacter maritimus]
MKSKKLDQNTSEIEELFITHHSLLCLVSYTIVKDNDVAKDVVQDFFISYWQKRRTLSINTSFQAYAIRAVKNLSLIAVKKSLKQQPLDFILYNHAEEVPNIAERPSTDRRLWELVNRLPVSRKDIFIAFVVQGHSYAEIAELKGISINTVKTQMKRAYAFLKSEANENSFFFIYLFCIISTRLF